MTYCSNYALNGKTMRYIEFYPNNDHKNETLHFMFVSLSGFIFHYA